MSRFEADHNQGPEVVNYPGQQLGICFQGSNFTSTSETLDVYSHPWQVGTLNYMSPEAILGGANNIRGGPPMKVQMIFRLLWFTMPHPLTSCENHADINGVCIIGIMQTFPHPDECSAHHLPYLDTQSQRPLMKQ